LHQMNLIEFLVQEYCLAPATIKKNLIYFKFPPLLPNRF
jgi:hypothetical protein